MPYLAQRTLMQLAFSISRPSCFEPIFTSTTVCRMRTILQTQYKATIGIAAIFGTGRFIGTMVLKSVSVSGVGSNCQKTLRNFEVDRKKTLGIVWRPVSAHLDLTFN